MNRFFADAENISGGEARIGGEDVRHISKVLRLSPGDPIAICDGEGHEYAARIVRIEKDVVIASLEEKITCTSEPRCKVTLFQCLPKAGKMELIIQKCVELGIYSVKPVASERCVVRINEREWEQKKKRYQRVAYEAAKQSRRGIIPEIGQLTDFCKADFSPYDLVLVAYEEERGCTLKSALHGAAPKEIALVIGPEGGLDAAEVECLKNIGCVCVSLGERILRTETAGMAALAMILYELEG